MLSEFTPPAWLSDLTPVDWLVLLFIALWAVKGAFKGFPTELGRLVVLIVALVGGWPLFGALTKWFQEVQPGLKNRAAGELLCFLVCFLIVYLAARLIQTVVAKTFAETVSGIFTRIGGAMIGGTRAVMLYMVILLAIGVSGLRDVRQLAIEESVLGERIGPQLPETYRRLQASLPFLPTLPESEVLAGDFPDIGQAGVKETNPTAPAALEPPEKPLVTPLVPGLPPPGSREHTGR